MSTTQHQLSELSPEKRALFERLLRQREAAKKASSPASTTPMSSPTVSDASSLIPWERAAWFGETCADLKLRLQRLGLETVGPVERFQASQDACILRIPLADRHLYFKAVPQFFACEIPMTRMIAEAFPKHAPEVLDSGDCWYLMDQLPGRPLSFCEDVTDWRRAMGDFARIQVAFIERRDELLAAGRRDRELSRLIPRTETFLASRHAACFAAISIFDRLGALLPALGRRVDELAALGLPSTLDHGDFHAHNIHFDQGRAIFFDFSDGSLAHPLFSPLALIGYIEHKHPQRIRHIEALRDAYFEPWLALFPRQKLMDAFVLARPLATLHYLLNMSECLADRPRPSVAESTDIRQAMDVCVASIIKDLEASGAR